METATQTATPMERLKAGIWDIHEGVTSGTKTPTPDEDNVMSGKLPRFKYVNNLKQRYILQGAFEKVLSDYRGKTPYLSTVVTDEQFHAPKAAEDLRFFGVDPATVTAIPTTKKMIEFFDATARKDARLLLAIHYVIEGSNNGAMFIAKAVKQTYGLEGTDGTLHLQPYGPAIRDKWKAFANSFNALEYDDALLTEMIAVGRQAFHHMNAIASEAYRQPEAAA